MRIEVYFSDRERKLPYFEELKNYVSCVLDSIPGLLDVFCHYMEECYVEEKTQKACCKSVRQSRRNKAVKK